MTDARYRDGCLFKHGHRAGCPYWDGPAGDEMRRLDRLALDDLAAKEDP